ncbi:hypothetical protein [Natrinema sp. SYSU A 869]|uniref:hypothetical protein n=1 Tax=Natrinema sp. SYSU A 869 TaxID=2871694 RepID=UPI001CA423EF|nr:hypothetical protein [Natrinema sp. SYSU A 869]
MLIDDDHNVSSDGADPSQVHSDRTAAVTKRAALAVAAVADATGVDSRRTPESGLEADDGPIDDHR